MAANIVSQHRELGKRLPVGRRIKQTKLLTGRSLLLLVLLVVVVLLLLLLLLLAKENS